MSTPQVHRQDNGVEAAHYEPCVVVEADDVTVLLGNLAATGIAAFVDGDGCVHVAADDVDDAVAVTRASLAGRPWSRVHGSAAAASPTVHGESHLDPAETGTPPAPASPEVWDDGGEPQQPPGPRSTPETDGLASPGVDEHAQSSPMSAHPSGSSRWSRRLRGPVDPDSLADDHYVPPHPPALPKTNALTLAGWLGVLGAPAFVLIMSLLGIGISTFWLLASLAVFLGGFAILLIGSPDRPPTDSGWDDGAVL